MYNETVVRKSSTGKNGFAAVQSPAKEKTMAELLSPAGNMEKLKAAFLYGADAVYCAGKAFGMRQAADNFETEELYEAVRYAHALEKKLYLTLNTLPGWREYDQLEQFLYDLKGCPLDGMIIADPGVLMLAKKLLPEVPVHISTQAGAVSHADCTFWQSLGATRVVLARELSFEDIRAIRQRISGELELEVFIHGSMCVSFSGRCLLSENLVGRNANNGCCAQPCRWNFELYEIAEEKRPESRFPVMVGNNAVRMGGIVTQLPIPVGILNLVPVSCGLPGGQYRQDRKLCQPLLAQKAFDKFPFQFQLFGIADMAEGTAATLRKGRAGRGNAHF